MPRRQRVLSEIFVLLPNRRQYPDYYQLTPNPISLEQIRDRLDTHAYTGLDRVKADLEQCFANAKAYNLPDSQIYKDARSLLVRTPLLFFCTPQLTPAQKLTRKEYARITGHAEEGSDDEGKKKDKTGNLFKLCRARLQKLVEMTDDK
jgi:chromatin structure-remodeling complex subunit RSC4